MSPLHRGRKGSPPGLTPGVVWAFVKYLLNESDHRPTHLGVSKTWHWKAAMQPEGQQGVAVSPACGELSKFIAQLPPLLHYHPLLATTLPISGHLTAMVLLSQCSCRPWQAPLPGGAGSYENTGLTSELQTSHSFRPLAIWGYPGPKESWLPNDSVVQNPTSLQGANRNRAPGGYLGSGLLALLS